MGILESAFELFHFTSEETEVQALRLRDLALITQLRGAKAFLVISYIYLCNSPQKYL